MHRIHEIRKDKVGVEGGAPTRCFSSIIKINLVLHRHLEKVHIRGSVDRLCTARLTTLTWNSKSAALPETLYKGESIAVHAYITPVILATQEAEIRKIEVRSQPMQNSS
jgi:hypothetical protein